MAICRGLQDTCCNNNVYQAEKATHSQAKISHVVEINPRTDNVDLILPNTLVGCRTNERTAVVRNYVTFCGQQPIPKTPNTPPILFGLPGSKIFHDYMICFVCTAKLWETSQWRLSIFCFCRSYRYPKFNALSVVTFATVLASSDILPFVVCLFVSARSIKSVVNVSIFPCANILQYKQYIFAPNQTDCLRQVNTFCRKSHPMAKKFALQTL